MIDQGDAAVIIVCGLAMLAMMTVAQAEELADPVHQPAVIEQAAAQPLR